jgi:hypothetical protein
MNRKPPPTDADVKDLAKRLKALWASGQSVRPFLRQHAALFRELQSDGWSWVGLALTLNKARITYRTGKPWTADSLVQAFSRAQASSKARKIQTPDPPPIFDKSQTNLIKAGDKLPLSSRPTEPSLTLPPSLPVFVEAKPPSRLFVAADSAPEPEFKPARFIDWDERRRDAERMKEMGQELDARAMSSPTQPHSQHFLEIMEYLTGKKPSL